jgi:hypothetical protein
VTWSGGRGFLEVEETRGGHNVEFLEIHSVRDTSCSPPCCDLCFSAASAGAFVARCVVAKGFLLTFSDQPFDSHDVERLWLRGDDESGNWYEGDVPGEYMENWLCPALILYFEKPPLRLYVRCDPLPAGVNPIWNPPPGEEGRRFVEAR